MSAILEAYLDREQGTNPDLLKARELLHEPAGSKDPYYRVLLPQEPYYSYRSASRLDVTEWTDRNIVTFERDEVIAPGCSFWVWRALRDGKIYL